MPQADALPFEVVPHNASFPSLPVVPELLEPRDLVVLKYNDMEIVVELETIDVDFLACTGRVDDDHVTFVGSRHVAFTSANIFAVRSLDNSYERAAISGGNRVRLTLKQQAEHGMRYLVSGLLREAWQVTLMAAVLSHFTRESFGRSLMMCGFMVVAMKMGSMIDIGIAVYQKLPRRRS